MTPAIVPFEADAHLDWIALTDAIWQAHSLPKAHISDSFLYRGDDTLLLRSAWINGLGLAVKAATVFPENPASDLPRVNGGVSLFGDDHGLLEAVVDFHLVTKWKTAGDSLLAARRLARPDSRNILIIGAGTVGANMIDAYSAAFPDAQFTVWNRTTARATEMAADIPGLKVATDLPEAVAQADIICCATMSTEPVLRGAWLQPGQHVDLIGAYRPDMREADTEALTRARLFVDSRETTIDHIGELKLPIAAGEITPDHVIADFYDGAAFARQTPEEITICKNGGGAHLDLMVSRYILEAWRAAQ
ncbi:NAD(P)-binding domain-containing protein [Donghicola sp. C2-DW-16]|uniref:NAD(P)-binding domain-containing protein n=1 Tax=Donghicola mangrovi TaxID=2729614 RepID=A0ABX2PBH2_9RHOB|nr:NAD(P)-binding domain-containing protein [Donghicola mangrovi]NVO26301.1 NAD(P)-binding domain-containing protein [Donghicola mangrovi]